MKVYLLITSLVFAIAMVAGEYLDVIHKKEKITARTIVHWVAEFIFAFMILAVCSMCVYYIYTKEL